eukprot:gb/GFBE01081621.1/.p1 GENE.gb/GFBE01081621.1/~~gb/GFBE01081621.1/.p1  ORF type:complete len:101 (+),score=23.93 gb/GFBE01081621.1/:1-303(+)
MRVLAALLAFLFAQVDPLAAVRVDFPFHAHTDEAKLDPTEQAQLSEKVNSMEKSLGSIEKAVQDVADMTRKKIECDTICGKSNRVGYLDDTQANGCGCRF